ncbi:VOC family protein [Galactobacter caseinivorans]|uniref:VOC family protein n=1 Tax=Galactobacter caseinivorans TaxID=2676123 RepID=A0A496PGE2_9MICC|nr:VOC family protein [Galactobacter caseinivorans]RKW69394.1 VOC family protein [Galactobacter caseinivorans]
MKLGMMSVFVDDQRAALDFYTEKLGFVKKHDIPLGGDFWITVVSPEDPDGPELLLEPAGHPAVKPYRDALMADGIPLAQFAVTDLSAEVERLRALGVEFTQDTMDIGTALIAVLNDGCGNLIQLIQMKPENVPAS